VNWILANGNISYPPPPMGHRVPLFIRPLVQPEDWDDDGVEPLEDGSYSVFLFSDIVAPKTLASVLLCQKNSMLTRMTVTTLQNFLLVIYINSLWKLGGAHGQVPNLVIVVCLKRCKWLFIYRDKSSQALAIGEESRIVSAFVVGIDYLGWTYGTI
jgi:hypothetical protein